MNKRNDTFDRHKKNTNEVLGVIIRQKNTVNHSKGIIVIFRNWSKKNKFSCK
jgi:hypothetical protein